MPDTSFAPFSQHHGYTEEEQANILKAVTLLERSHGYAPAVNDKEAWHWGMPFNLDDGSRPVRNADGTVPEVKPCETYPELFSNWMLSEMKKDKTLIAVTAGTPTAAGFTADKRKEAVFPPTVMSYLLAASEMLA